MDIFAAMKTIFSLLFVALAGTSMAQSESIDMTQSGLRCYNMKAGSSSLDTAIFSKKFKTMFTDRYGDAVLKFMVIPNHPGVMDKGALPMDKRMTLLEEKQYNNNETLVLYNRLEMAPPKPDQSKLIYENYTVSVSEECAVIVSCHYPIEMQGLLTARVKEAAETVTLIQ